MADDSGLSFAFPAIHGRKVTAAFDGGRLTSDGGVLLLGQAERRLGIAARLARCIADPRDQSRVVRSSADILRARILAISCGYEDANDIDTLRHDPEFKLALGKLPEGPVGLDIRFVVTSLTSGSAEYLYDTLHCARGQAENLIKLHKSQLTSDRTSCRSANANQMRIILHTAAYWLMWSIRQAMPANTALRTAEFATIRLRLLKVAARVMETASRIRVAFASACPEATLFRSISLTLRAAGP